MHLYIFFRQKNKLNIRWWIKKTWWLPVVRYSDHTTNTLFITCTHLDRANDLLPIFIISILITVIWSNRINLCRWNQALGAVARWKPTAKSTAIFQREKAKTSRKSVTRITGSLRKWKTPTIGKIDPVTFEVEWDFQLY